MPEYITADMFSSMFLSGTRALKAQKAYINELNVFPVPDGDTGTNMALTLDSAIAELSRLSKGFSLEEAGKALTGGALRGARGNSGVILSQLIRGFSKGLSGLANLTREGIAHCLSLADEMARKAVSNPKEGTILTVARAAASRAAELCRQEALSMEAFLKEIIAYADYVLSRTPEMLPVLKEAGVVDSGGKGLVEFFKGTFEAFTGKAPVYDLDREKVSGPVFEGHAGVDSSDIETSNIKYTYCTEFIVNLKEKISSEEEEAFKAYLEGLGDSLVFVSADDMIKIHVHTNHPGRAFEKGLEYGSLTRMKIDNMKEEHEEKLSLEEESRAFEKEYAFVCVCSGEGFKELFKSMSVDVLVEGGQTMNPSASEIASAIKSAKAQSVFVLPNNPNVILTARQARELCPEVNVEVIPTRNIPEGISAVINYVPALSISDNAEHMTKEISNIKTAEITSAIRDSEMEGVKIKKDDYMALSGDHVISENKELSSCVLQALKNMMDEDSEIVSIYYGADVKKDEAEDIAFQAQKNFEEADFEVVFGGQPVYDYVISVE